MVRYAVHSKQASLIGSVDNWRKINAIFARDERVLVGPDRLGSQIEGERNRATASQYCYTVNHTVIGNGGIKGITAILKQLWGRVTSTLQHDVKGKTISVTIGNVEQYPLSHPQVQEKFERVLNA